VPLLFPAFSRFSPSEILHLFFEIHFPVFFFSSIESFTLSLSLSPFHKVLHSWAGYHLTVKLPALGSGKKKKTKGPPPPDRSSGVFLSFRHTDLDYVVGLLTICCNLSLSLDLPEDRTASLSSPPPTEPRGESPDLCGSAGLYAAAGLVPEEKKHVDHLHLSPIVRQFLLPLLDPAAT
jgi:hypothetical protein